MAEFLLPDRFISVYQDCVAGDNQVVPPCPQGRIRICRNIAASGISLAGAGTQCIISVFNQEAFVIRQVAREYARIGGGAEIVEANIIKNEDVVLQAQEYLNVTIPAGDTGIFGCAYFDVFLETKEVQNG